MDYFLEDYYSEANSIFIEKGKNLNIKDLEEKLIDADFEKTYYGSTKKGIFDKRGYFRYI